MNKYKGVPGLRKLYIFQFAKNHKYVNLGVYPEIDPENIAYPKLLTVKCPFSILDITKLQKSTMKSSWGVGCAGGAYNTRTTSWPILDYTRYMRYAASLYFSQLSEIVPT